MRPAGRVRAVVAGVACGVACAVLVSAGCESASGALAGAGSLGATRGANQAAALDWPDDSAAYQSLVRLRDSGELVGAGGGISPGPVLPVLGIDAADLEPIEPGDDGFEHARVSLAEALAAQITPPTEPAEVGPPPTEAAMVRAQRFYASGVAKLVDGDAAGAARDLSAAAQLDPTAPSPWLRLAEAQAAQGQAAASILSRRRAVDLGSDDAVSLAVLGLQAARIGQHEQAAHYLARCLAARPERADPLLRPVVLVRIADPLRQLGYLAASNEALRAGLDLPDRINAPTRFGDEAADLARRASDLWVRIGDTSCRLGDDAAAAEAYEIAADVPSVDPAAVLARRAYVLLRSGRTASVALLALDSIAAKGGRANGRDLALVRVLRDEERVGRLVREGLDDLTASLGSVGSAAAPTSRSLLTIARATASGDARAVELLRARVDESPRDRRVLDALFARCAGSAAVESEVLSLVGAHPGAAGEIVESALPWHARPGDWRGSLAESVSGNGAVETEVALRLDLAMSRAGSAAARLAPDQRDQEDQAGQGDQRSGGGVEPLASAETRAMVLAADGRLGEARALFGSMSPVSRARVLREARRYGEAYDAVRPALGEDAGLGELLLGAELALASGDADAALSLLGRAAIVDPYDMRVYEGLINTHQARGDQQGAAVAVRELRGRAPSSELLRWVGAQEEARRGLLDQAERAARGLVEGTSRGGPALGLLLTIWSQRASVDDTAALEDAAAWLDARCETTPVTSELLAARGNVLALLDRREEAEAALRAALEARPTPTVSESLEVMLRDSGRAEEADELARERLAWMGDGLAGARARGKYHALRSEWAQAAAAMERAMPEGVRVPGEMQSEIVLIAGSIDQVLRRGESPELAGPLRSLLDVAEARGMAIPWQLLHTRWAIAAQSGETTSAEVVGAARAFLAAVPSVEVAQAFIGDTANQLQVAIDTLDQARGQVAYQLASTLYGSGREDAALAVYETALEYSPDHPWALNDLGYFLAERHERLDEAARMLERAHELRPGEANIADSLGWLRYKLGQFESQTLADGTVREGAVSLLLAASGLPGGESNPTVHDHLGDALWRSGERERAEASWVRAQQLLVADLARLRGESPRRDRLTEQASAVGAKLDALRAGGEPPVAGLMEQE